jgi:hypothetical protein
MKILLPALAAVMVIGAVATATPAQARCWWSGYGWQCGQRFQQSYNPWRYGRRDNWGYIGGGWHNGGGYNGGWHNSGGYNR